MYPSNNNALGRMTEVLNKSSSGVIVLPINPSVDAISAATSLYLGLTRIGKNVSVACATAIKSDLVGTDKIQSSLSTSGDNLLISFPYTDGAIDKVDYRIEGNNFNLIVAPRSGYPKLDPKQVKFSYTGGLIDFIITVDTPSLNSLGDLYTQNPSLFQGKNIINIDRHLTNSFFGSINFVQKTSSSTSELIFKILTSLNYEIDKDMATNLYTGIATATNNFTSYSVNAETFETVSKLLKLGAVKKIRPKQASGQPTFNAPTTGSFQPHVFQPDFNPAPQPTTPAAPQIIPPVNFEKQGIKPIESVEKEPQPSNNQNQTPQDWLKPKIFRGGGLI